MSVILFDVFSRECYANFQKGEKDIDKLSIELEKKKTACLEMKKLISDIVQFFTIIYLFIFFTFSYPCVDRHLK